MFSGTGRARQRGYASHIQRFAEHGKRNGDAATGSATKANLAGRCRAAHELASASGANPYHLADFLSLHKYSPEEQIAPRVSQITVQTKKLIRANGFTGLLSQLPKRRIAPSSSEKAPLFSRRLLIVSKSPNDSHLPKSQSLAMAATSTSGSPSRESRLSAPM